MWVCRRKDWITFNAFAYYTHIKMKTGVPIHGRPQGHAPTNAGFHFDFNIDTQSRFRKCRTSGMFLSGTCGVLCGKLIEHLRNSGNLNNGNDFAWKRVE